MAEKSADGKMQTGHMPGTGLSVRNGRDQALMYGIHPDRKSYMDGSAIL
jgi:hypothetical protein